MRRPSARRLVRAALCVAAVLSALVALVGFAHTGPGRPLLALLKGGAGGAARGASAGCPLGLDGGGRSAAAREAQRRRQAEHRRGEGQARSRPALGFELEGATRREVRAWAEREGLSCRKAAPAFGDDLDCADVAANRLPDDLGGGLAAKSLWFQFDADDRLVAVTALRHAEGAEAAVDALRGRVERLRSEVGPASKTQGELSAAYLSAGLLRQSRFEFAFGDYYAKASVTKVRSNEYVLAEEYRALPR